MSGHQLGWMKPELKNGTNHLTGAWRKGVQLNLPLLATWTRSKPGPQKLEADEQLDSKMWGA